MTELHRYRAHSIELELIDVAENRVRWRFFLDNAASPESSDLLKERSAARSDALRVAYLQIDLLCEASFSRAAATAYGRY